MIDNLPLLNAIDTVPEKVLRELFKSICKGVPEARTQAVEQLLVENTTSDNDEEEDSEQEDHSHDEAWMEEALAFEEPYPEESDAEEESENDSEKPSESMPKTSNIKTVAPRYAICQNCEKDFETDKNSSTACRYHPKRSEPTEEMDVDVYDGEDFEVDSEDMRADFPENFEFPCCGATLKDNPHGCKVGLHVDASAQRDKTVKRARFH